MVVRPTESNNLREELIVDRMELQLDLVQTLLLEALVMEMLTLAPIPLILL
jgi:hypothetical protein